MSYVNQHIDNAVILALRAAYQKEAQHEPANPADFWEFAADMVAKAFFDENDDLFWDWCWDYFNAHRDSAEKLFPNEFAAIAADEYLAEIYLSDDEE